MMWRIVLMLGCLLSLVPLEAHAGVHTTMVAGTVYRADGSAAAGTLIVSWPPFVTAEGEAVAAGTTTVQIGTNGGISLALAPNEGATPAGSYYTAVYHLNDGTVNKEYWLVPQVPNATLAVIRAKVVPAAVAVPMTGTGSVSAVYQLMSGNFLPLGGGTLNGPLTLNAQPTLALQAVSKSYVDTALGGISATSLGALPLAGGTVSGDIVAKDGTPMASQAYVAQHAMGATASGAMGAVQINNGKGALGTDSGLMMDTTNHILNIPGQITMGSEENAPRGVYDPMNPKYAGGLGNATTAAQQQAAIQAALDQAACDEKDGKISGADVIYPAGINSGISELMVHSGITFKCSTIQGIFGGACQLYESAPFPPVPTPTTGHVMIRLDYTNHGMCHGVDTAFGGANASVVGFGFSGEDGVGGLDEGVRAYDIHDYVAHNSFNAFGGPAVEMSGAPGDGVAEWNYIQNSPKFYIENPTVIPPDGAFVAALECDGEDSTCNNNEVSTGSVQSHGGARQANYPHVAAMLVDGGSARINNNFVQVSDVGLVVNCCAAGSEINGLRADLMAGAAIYMAGGGNVLTGIDINQPCEDPAWVDPTTHVSGCHAIESTATNTFSGVSVGPFGGFGPSYMGAMFSADQGNFNSYTNNYPLDAYGNGANFSNAGDLYGNSAPAGAQQITTSCSFSGQTAIRVNDCTHIQLTDAAPINVQWFYGIGDGKTITVEGTANDTLVNTNGSLYGAVGVETCSGANVQLGSGPLEFFYTTRDHVLHQICGGGTSGGQTAPASTTDPLFNANGNGEAELLTGNASVGTILTMNHNNHNWYWYCMDGTGCGVFDTGSGLQLMQMKTAGSTPYVATGVVALSEGTPASSTPAAGCVANSVWADDSYLYHCSADGVTVKRVALGSF